MTSRNNTLSIENQMFEVETIKTVIENIKRGIIHSEDTPFERQERLRILFQECKNHQISLIKRADRNIIKAINMKQGIHDLLNSTISEFDSLSAPISFGSASSAPISFGSASSAPFSFRSASPAPISFR